MLLRWGCDLSSNSRLRLACEKALSNNMPKDNIDRAIKKGSGANDSSSFENITYEGYGYRWCCSNDKLSH